MNRAYVILSPKYQHNSGGIKVLYALFEALKKAKQEAYLINEPWEFPKELDRENTVAVYPEIYPGNPLGCKYVARYVLNKPGLIAGDKTYDKDEMVFVYSEMLLGFLSILLQSFLLF